jgi:hypothetical protein
VTTAYTDLDMPAATEDVYVPCSLPSQVGPTRAWAAGFDGRLVLDPLCASANDLLADGGTMLLVQSEFAGPGQTLAMLPAPDWTPKSLHGNGFPVAQCWRMPS